MIKKINFVSVLALVLSILLISPSGLVHAEKITPPSTHIPGLAGGTWSTGTEVEINLDASKYPGLQLLTKGVVITQPVKLCHEFRGGDYGWVAEIRMFKKGVWVKQPTTSGWVPDAEGVYTACTDASAAGTYALFGWFDPTSPKVRAINLPRCDSDLLYYSGFDFLENTAQNGDTIFSTSFSFLIPTMPNSPMTLSIVKAVDKLGSTMAFDTSLYSATDITDGEGSLSLVKLISGTEPTYFHVILSTPTCYFDIDPLKIIY
jgi:hypothetical protein